jgi:DNA polymerase-3 subunit delta
MATTPEEVLRALEKGEYAPIYFLQGSEPFFIDQISDFIEENAIDESQKSFNLMVLYGKEVDITQILLNARRFPMMSDRQVVIVKEAQSIESLKSEDGRKLLEDYVDNPQPSTILVFCHKHKKIDGRSSLAKKLKKGTIFIETEQLKDYNLPTWIDNYASSLDLVMAPDATQLMADHIGTNLERITNELKKIKNNLGDDNKVSAAVIHKYVGINKDYNVFELNRALQYRDIVKVNKIVNYFDKHSKSQSIIPIVALIHSMFSKLLKVHMSKDKSDKALARAAGVSPYFLKEYKTGMSNYSPAVVLRNMGYILEADLHMKGVDRPGISDGQVLRDLVFKLMH